MNRLLSDRITGCSRIKEKIYLEIAFLQSELSHCESRILTLQRSSFPRPRFQREVYRILLKLLASSFHRRRPIRRNHKEIFAKFLEIIYQARRRTEYSKRPAAKLNVTSPCSPLREPSSRYLRAHRNQDLMEQSRGGSKRKSHNSVSWPGDEAGEKVSNYRSAFRFDYFRRRNSRATGFFRLLARSLAETRSKARFIASEPMQDSPFRFRADATPVAKCTTMETLSRRSILPWHTAAGEPVRDIQPANFETMGPSVAFISPAR